MREQVGASCVAQATASVVTYPHEVLRSHMHVEGSTSLRSMLHTLRQVGQGSAMLLVYRPSNALISQYLHPCSIHMVTL